MPDTFISDICTRITKTLKTDTYQKRQIIFTRTSTSPKVRSWISPRNIINLSPWMKYMLEMSHTLSTREVRFLQKKIRWQVWSSNNSSHKRVWCTAEKNLSKISKYQHTHTQIRKFKWKVLWDLRYYAESWKVTKQDKYLSDLRFCH